MGSRYGNLPSTPSFHNNLAWMKRINLILKIIIVRTSRDGETEDLAKEIALKHQTGITEAKTRYEASHKSNLRLRTSVECARRHSVAKMLFCTLNCG